MASFVSGRVILSPGAAFGGNPWKAAGLEFTLMVRVLVSVPFPGNVPDGGLKLHVMPVGKPGQLKVN